MCLGWQRRDFKNKVTHQHSSALPEGNLLNWTAEVTPSRVDADPKYDLLSMQGRLDSRVQCKSSKLQWSRGTQDSKVNCGKTSKLHKLLQVVCRSFGFPHPRESSKYLKCSSFSRNSCHLCLKNHSMMLRVAVVAFLETCLVVRVKKKKLELFWSDIRVLPERQERRAKPTGMRRGRNIWYVVRDNYLSFYLSFIIHLSLLNAS